MSKAYGDHLDLEKQQIQNAVIHPLASAPASPAEGQIYYDTATKQTYQWNGTAWASFGGGGLDDVTQTSASGGAGRMKVSAGANKAIVDYATSGIVKSDGSGVVSAAVADTDYATPGLILTRLLTGYTAGTNAVIAATDSVLDAFRKLQAQITGYGATTKTLTNTTIDANGTGNSISNLETADFAANVIDNDSTLTANSSTRLPTQQAVKTFVTNAVTGLYDDRGNFDASAGTFPSTGGSGIAGAIMKGDIWRISVAGTLGGVVYQIGDTLRALIDTPGATASNWDGLQANIGAATTTVTGSVILATQAEAEARTDTSKAVTPSALVNFPVKYSATIGDGTTTQFTVTHNKNTRNFLYMARRVSDNKELGVGISNITLNAFDVTFGTAPATNNVVLTYGI